MANLSVLMLWPGLIVSGSMASRLASALMGETCELLFISAMPDRPVPEVEGCEPVSDPVAMRMSETAGVTSSLAGPDPGVKWTGAEPQVEDAAFCLPPCWIQL